MPGESSKTCPESQFKSDLLKEILFVNIFFCIPYYFRSQTGATKRGSVSLILASYCSIVLKLTVYEYSY